ncbi:MAG TPA: NAD(+)/NADH kinase [Chloroflexi bacterium]|jgi:NAD+ kinase|nr:NAD(+)/NADH kinase [Chloroflexota bacterium]
MQRVGILYQPSRVESRRLAHTVHEVLDRHGVAVWQGSAEDEQALGEAATSLDLLITLGGDGTIVHAVHAVSPAGVPILGVNLGRLGFLAEVEPSEIHSAIPRVLEGDYLLEERMMLHAEVYRDGQRLLVGDAINDAFMGRGRTSRAVRISVDVDDHYVMTQTADGIIVSTPTGSTAYCLSAGGPIIAPDVDCLAVTPVAAHLAVAHAIVIPADRVLRLRLIKGDDAVLTVDGQTDVDLAPGDEVHCTQSEVTAKFIRFGTDGYFYETVLRRLRWPDQGPIP